VREVSGRDKGAGDFETTLPLRPPPTSPGRRAVHVGTEGRGSALNALGAETLAATVEERNYSDAFIRSGSGLENNDEANTSFGAWSRSTGARAPGAKTFRLGRRGEEETYGTYFLFALGNVL